MTGLTLTLRSTEHPPGRVSLAGITPAFCNGKTESDLANHAIMIGCRRINLGDLFSISGSASDRLVLEGLTDSFDDVGEGLDTGTIIVDGTVGGYAGRKMTGGTLSISGDAGPFLASRMSGGKVMVSGSAGDYVGGIKAGEKFGMTGGIVVVEGTVGDRAGDRMRRGTIITRSTFGAHAASRMMGGTLWTEAGFGPEPGPLLRRGTLIGPNAKSLLPTYIDGGHHDLGVLRILSRHMKAELGDKAPKPLPEKIRKFSGDMATIGKGELLLFDQ